MLSPNLTTTIPNSTIKNLALLDRMPDFARDVYDLKTHLIVLMQYGSHLYGTNTPDSDVDIKGVFIPTKEQIMLGRIPKAYTYQPKKAPGEKNQAGDVDIQIFSFHYFLEMACQGETLSIDMLHAREGQCIVWSDAWESLHALRSSFYTKDMKAFVGYARTQAAKYGIKGSRLDAVKEVVEFMFQEIGVDTELPKIIIKMKDVWDRLPAGEHIHKLDPNPRDKNGNHIYQVCGKQFLENTPLHQVQACLGKFYAEYGERARLAQENKGIDWKAVSHALRAAYQLQEIFESGDLKFPLRGAQFLKNVKKGKLPWENVREILEINIEKAEALASQTSYPAKVSRNKIDNWLMDTVAWSIGLIRLTRGNG